MARGWSCLQRVRAGAPRCSHRTALLLTHFWPGNDREKSRAWARETFGGEVLLADENLTITLETT
jgi:hypothetical protein